MNHARPLLWLLVILVGRGTAQRPAQPQVFAPGVISGRDVFGITFTPDGNTVYFCETDPEIRHIQIMESHRLRDSWSAPQAASFSPGSYRDIDPFVTPDGQHLIFESNRPAPGRADSRADFDVYILDRQENGWSQPRSLSDINTEANEVFVTATRKGSLYFSSDRAGGKGKADIYVTKKKGTGYAPPINLSAMNTDDVDGNPASAPNEKFLIFSRAGDLFVSHRNGEHWNTPEKLPLVNTAEDTEYAPAFFPDGKSLYFTSTKFENNKRVKPGTIWFIPLEALKLPPAK